MQVVRFEGRGAEGVLNSKSLEIVCLFMTQSISAYSPFTRKLSPVKKKIKNSLKYILTY